MVDYAAWVQRAKNFTAGLEGRLAGEWETENSVAPPVDEPDLVRTEDTLERRLPLSLRSYFGSGSRCCECRYVWTPEGISQVQMNALFPGSGYIYGGARLCDAQDLTELLEECQVAAGSEGFEDAPEQEAFWLNALPFAWIRNGDKLGLDMRQKDKPPVVYLAHDDDSKVIAPDFDTFLETWERLCYIGPEIWLLKEFINQETGLLDPNSVKAIELRRLFGVAE